MFYARTTIPVLLFLLVLQSPFAIPLDVIYNPPVTFSFPCSDNPQYLTQEFQVPVDKDNTTKTTWKGVFYVEQWISSANVKLDIVFDHPAEIEVSPRAVHIIYLDGTGANDRRSFRLTTVQSPKIIHKIEFKVSQVKDGQFPSVLSMSVNGRVLCDNKDRKTNFDLIQRLQNKEQATGQTKNRCGQRQPILAEASDNSRAVIDWPWRISLYAKETETNNWSLVCGGTLIGPNRVLTAGQCVKGRDLEEILVEIGNENVTVKNLSIHRDYQQQSLQDDIAVLLIEDPKPEEEPRYPICLNADWANLSGNVTLGTFDRSKDEFESQNVIDGIICLESNREVFGKYLSTKNLCAKPESGESQLIPGDGLYEQFYDEDHFVSAWKIKGIASYTKSGPFFLFTDVSKYQSFIKDSFI